MTLHDALVEIEVLAASGPAPAEPYWIEYPDGEQSDSYYCETCAENVRDYTGGEPLGNYDPIPSEGPELCAVCGCILEYSLVDVGEELSHFESRLSGAVKRVDGRKKLDASEWREVYEIAIQIERVESSYWPDDSERPSDIERDRALYARTMDMVDGFFGLEASPAPRNANHR